MKSVYLFNSCNGRHHQLVSYVLASASTASTAIPSFSLERQGATPNYPIGNSCRDPLEPAPLP
jgi:hypothetical protein